MAQKRVVDVAGREQSSDAPEAIYAEVVETLCRNPEVALGVQGKKGFGSTSLTVDGKIFAMLDSRQQFVVKLPRQRVDALVAAGAGRRFDRGKGQPMKEWLAVHAASVDEWLGLASEALAFVSPKRG